MISEKLYLNGGKYFILHVPSSAVLISIVFHKKVFITIAYSYILILLLHMVLWLAWTEGNTVYHNPEPVTLCGGNVWDLFDTDLWFKIWF